MSRGGGWLQSVEGLWVHITMPSPTQRNSCTSVSSLWENTELACCDVGAGVLFPFTFVREPQIIFSTDHFLSSLWPSKGDDWRYLSVVNTLSWRHLDLPCIKSSSTPWLDACHGSFSSCHGSFSSTEGGPPHLCKLTSGREGVKKENTKRLQPTQFTPLDGSLREVPSCPGTLSSKLYGFSSSSYILY